MTRPMIHVAASPLRPVRIDEACPMCGSYAPVISGGVAKCWPCFIDWRMGSQSPAVVTPGPAEEPLPSPVKAAHGGVRICPDCGHGFNHAEHIRVCEHGAYRAPVDHKAAWERKVAPVMGPMGPTVVIGVDEFDLRVRAVIAGVSPRKLEGKSPREMEQIVREAEANKKARGV